VVAGLVMLLLLQRRKGRKGPAAASGSKVADRTSFTRADIRAPLETTGLPARQMITADFQLPPIANYVRVRVRFGSPAPQV
jgi:hypothetical protein